MTPNAKALTMTFDEVLAGTSIPYGESYTENGMMVTSYSYNSEIGDPLKGNPTNALYFHGGGLSIAFNMVGGYHFDLISFTYYTNGWGDGRWIETSKGVKLYLQGVLTPKIINFSGSGFTDIEWFSVVTPGFAIEVDTINVNSYSTSVPDTSVMLLLNLG